MTRRIYRKRAGASLIESVFGITILVPVLLLMFSCAEIFCAEEYNSRICRDAARQAASVCPAPTDRNGPLSAKSPIFLTATRVVEKGSIAKHSDQSTFSNVELVGVSLQGLKMQSAEDVEGPISGYVHVQTAITVNLPISLGSFLPSGLRLMSDYGFPITATSSATKPAVAIPAISNPLKPQVPHVQVNLYKGYQ
jgi:hypothetical protein